MNYQHAQKRPKPMTTLFAFVLSVVLAAFIIFGVIALVYVTVGTEPSECVPVQHSYGHMTLPKAEPPVRLPHPLPVGTPVPRPTGVVK